MNSNTYKPKLNANKNTTSERRKSKGLERKKNREIQVNKKRLLKDDMSPVRETGVTPQGSPEHSQTKKNVDKKPIAQKAAADSRLERLQRWRLERNKKKQDEIAGKQVFKSGKVEHRDAYLFNMGKPSQATNAKEKASTASKKVSTKTETRPVIKKAISQPMLAKPDQPSSSKSVQSRSAASNKQTAPLSKTSKTTTETKSLRSTRSTVDTMKVEKELTSSDKKGAISKSTRVADFSTKLTAAAKAKMAEQKHTEFLRSKRTGLQVKKPMKGPNKAVPKLLKAEVKVAEKECVKETTGQVASSDEHTDHSGSELHLSDSAVQSPKHSTPAVARKTRKSIVKEQLSLVSELSVGSPRSKSQHVHTIKTPKENENAFSTDSEATESDAVHEDIEMEEVCSVPDIQVPQQKEINASALAKRKSLRTAGIVSSSSEQRENSQNNSSFESEAAENDIHEDVEMEEVGPVPDANHKDVQIAALVEATATPVSQQKLTMGSAVGHTPMSKQKQKSALRKRKSLRIAEVASSSSELRETNKNISSTEPETPDCEVASEEVEMEDDCPIRDISDKDVKISASVEAATPVSQQRLKMGSAVCATPVSQQKQRGESALGKRKSLRIAEIASSSSDVDSDIEKVRSVRKTPRRSSLSKRTKTPRRSSRRVSDPRKDTSVTRRSSQSTIVSVSDEGTTNLKGASVVDNVINKSVGTTVSCNSQLESSPAIPKENVRRSVGKSLVKTINGEEIAVNEALPPVAYHVGKSAAAGQESRALQELAVEKVEGELSFVEVPMDDSMVETPRRESSSSVVLTPSEDQSTEHFSPRNSTELTADRDSSLAMSEDQTKFVSLKTPDVRKVSSELEVDNSLQSLCLTTPGVKEENRQTPEAEHEQTAIKTPRSLRSRGRSLAPSSAFKEPGEPLSALRSKNTKRRKTEHCTPSKTPEQMLALLKKSPMIEMSRRRSRHISSPGISGNSFVALMDEADRANRSSPAILETTKPESEMTDTVESEIAMVDTAQLETVYINTAQSEVAMVDKAQSEEALVDAAQSEAAMEDTAQSEDDAVVLSYQEIQAAKVKPFRDTLCQEIIRLNGLCDEWTKISSQTGGISDEVQGEIRSVVGKAQLLIKDRFKQFSGLVDNCQFNSGAKETTTSDLQGFWEMIYFQVEDVNRLFAELLLMQQNGWQSTVEKPAEKKPILKGKPINKAVSKPKGKSNFASFRAEMIKRKAALAAAKAAEEAAEVAAEAAENEQENMPNKTFDGGFFEVQSPVHPSSRSTSPSKISQGPSYNDATHLKGAAPHNPSDKENKVGTPSSQHIPMSVKRLRYTPAVNSPLLNDITDALT